MTGTQDGRTESAPRKGRHWKWLAAAAAVALTAGGVLLTARLQNRPGPSEGGPAPRTSEDIPYDLDDRLLAPSPPPPLQAPR